MNSSLNKKRELIDWKISSPSITRQCELLGLSKGACYYHPVSESKENLILMSLIDKIYTDHPFYGSRRINVTLRKKGHGVNRKRIQRLMHEMGLEAIYPKQNLSKRNHEHKIYPYLLRGITPIGPK